MSPSSPFSPSRAFVSGRCGKWYAWHDFTQGAPTLYVTGECWPDMPGIRLVLKRAAAQEPNPRILVLEKVVTNLYEPHITPPIAMRYEECTFTKYTQVSIQPDRLFIDVVVVS